MPAVMAVAASVSNREKPCCGWNTEPRISEPAAHQRGCSREFAETTRASCLSAINNHRYSSGRVGRNFKCPEVRCSLRVGFRKIPIGHYYEIFGLKARHEFICEFQAFHFVGDQGQSRCFPRYTQGGKSTVRECACHCGQAQNQYDRRDER